MSDGSGHSGEGAAARGGTGGERGARSGADEAGDPIRASEEEGRRYRLGVYDPMDAEDLPAAPEDLRFPRRGSGPAYRVHDGMPRCPRLAHLIGPSMIALGMGLGAGEFLLWPNLVAVNGFTIWWLIIVGVLTQFVVIGEIERWTITTGESVFAGMARLDEWNFWPWFFLAATLVSFFWPGWASSSAEFASQIIGAVTGASLAWQPVALVMLAFIWVGLAGSKIVYNALERFEIGLVLGFFPLLLVALAFAGLAPEHVLELVKGTVSVGSVPREMLAGDQFPTLLIAVAYAGSGGTLLLAQSLWLRDKGFGMARYQGRIAGIRGENEEIVHTGIVFDPEGDATMLERFRAWMRTAERELLVTFVLLILLSLLITTLLVAATLGTDNTAMAGDLTGMVTEEARILEEAAGTWLRVVFLLGGSFVLFSTQLGIVDTVTRITGSIFYEQYGRDTRFWTLKKTFLFFLTVLVAASMAIVALSWTGGESVEALQPNFLVLIAGPFTIASMYAFALVVGYMNVRRLPDPFRPPDWKRWGMVWAGVLWGWFTAEQISRTVLSALGAPEAVVTSIAMHPVRIALYGLWVLSLVWFAVAVVGRPGAEYAGAGGGGGRGGGGREA